MNESKTIAALDIGTEKMQVLVGEILDNKTMHIVGMGRANSSGVKKGDIVDIRKAASDAQSAIINAERTTQASLKSVCLGISGTHIMGFRNIGSSNVSGADGIVRKADVERACEDAKSKALPDDRLYICRICCGFYLDGVFTTSPLGKKANHIDAEFWMIHGDAEKIYESMHLVKSFGLEVEELMFSGICSARATTTPAQREDGVLCIDIGCGTSDYVLYRSGKPFQTGVIPVGGDHITNDISLGMKLNRKNSESLKKRFASAIASEDSRDKMVWAVGNKQIGDQKISLYSIEKISAVRLEELFEIIRKEVDEYLDGESVKSVVITGGTSRIKRICELGESIFQLPCTTGLFNGKIKENLREGENATVIGLLDYALSEAMLKNRENKGVLQEAAGIFKKIFKR